MNQELSKKTAVKRILIILILTVILTLVFMLFQYDTFPTKAFLISMTIISFVIIISGILGYKYREQIAGLKNKLWYFFLVLGILDIVINSVLIFLEGYNMSYLVNFFVGVVLIVYSVYRIKKS